MFFWKQSIACVTFFVALGSAWANESLSYLNGESSSASEQQSVELSLAEGTSVSPEVSELQNSDSESASLKALPSFAKSLEINDGDYFEPTTVSEPPLKAFLKPVEEKKEILSKQRSWAGPSFSGTDEDWSYQPVDDLSVYGEFQQRGPASQVAYEDTGYAPPSGDDQRMVSAVFSGREVDIINDDFLYVGDHEEPLFLPEPAAGRDIALFDSQYLAFFPFKLENLEVMGSLPGQKKKKK